MKASLVVRCCIALAMAAVSSHAPAQSKGGAAPVTFKSLKELVEVLPHPLIQQFKVASKIEAGKQEANKIFMEKVVGKTATIKVRAEDWQPWSGPENNTDKMRITMVPVTLNILGTAFKANLWILIPPDQTPALGKISKGGEITVTGELTRFELEHTPEGLRLVGDLRHAKIEGR